MHWGFGVSCLHLSVLVVKIKWKRQSRLFFTCSDREKPWSWGMGQWGSHAWVHEEAPSLLRTNHPSYAHSFIVSQVKMSKGNWKNRWQSYFLMVLSCFKCLFSQRKIKNVIQIHLLPEEMCVLVCRIENKKKSSCFSHKCCCSSDTFLHFADKNRRWAKVFLYTIYNVGLVYSKEPQAAGTVSMWMFMSDCMKSNILCCY